MALEKPFDPDNPFLGMDRLYVPPTKQNRFTRLIIDESEDSEYNKETKEEKNDRIPGVSRENS